MINRPPANKIPIGAEWLNTMPAGQDWTPPNQNQPIVEIHRRTCQGKNNTPQQVVQYLYAGLRRQYLGQGTATDAAIRQWVQTVVGLPTDDAGHIIGRNQGGLGTVQWNIFPQSRNFNRGSYAEAETMMYNAANASATTLVPIWFRFNYGDTQNPCRPDSFDYFTIIPATPGVPPGEIILHDNIFNPH